MDEYPSNSQKARESIKPEPTMDKKIESVVKEAAIQRKTPLGRKIKELFVGGDARSVWSYVALDVMIPAAKDMMADAGSQFLERMLYGEVRQRGRARGGRAMGQNVNYTPYNRYVQPQGMREEPRSLSRRDRAMHNFDGITLGTRDDAEAVIDGLYEIVNKYGQATVSDLYELCGISGNFTDEKWGWTDLRGLSATRVRNGYLLDIIPPEPLD